MHSGRRHACARAHGPRQHAAGGAGQKTADIAFGTVGVLGGVCEGAGGVLAPPNPPAAPAGFTVYPKPTHTHTAHPNAHTRLHDEHVQRQLVHAARLADAAHSFCDSFAMYFVANPTLPSWPFSRNQLASVRARVLFERGRAVHRPPPTQPPSRHTQMPHAPR